jgi:selenium metabolism protein YedF
LDNEVAKQNFQDSFRPKTFTIRGREDGAIIIYHGSLEKESMIQDDTLPQKEFGTYRIFLKITSDCMGHGDDELGKRLMVNFIKTVKEMDNLWQIVFMNGGVKLTLDTSDAYEALLNLEGNGVRILSCGTCLSHFNLLDKKRAGETTNMLDVVTAMQVAVR